jgi:AcrR family transcriptional regulator
MGMRKPRPGPLTPADWARAALAAIARGGIAAVAVENVAADLGATKGSFYWHFKNRDALIRAALEEWERSRTEAVIEELELEPAPAERLRKLLEAAFERSPADRVEIALLADPGHPAATAAVRRVAQRRIAYIAEQLEKLGYDRGDARDRAVVLYYVYTGHLQMAHVAPEVAGDDTRPRHVQLILGALVADGLPAVRAGSGRDGA